MSLISSIKNESQNSLTNFAPCVKVGLIYFTQNLAEVTQSNQVSCQLIFNYYFLLMTPNAKFHQGHICIMSHTIVMHGHFSMEIEIQKNFWLWSKTVYITIIIKQVSCIRGLSEGMSFSDRWDVLCILFLQDRKTQMGVNRKE